MTQCSKPAWMAQPVVSSSPDPLTKTASVATPTATLLPPSNSPGLALTFPTPYLRPPTEYCAVKPKRSPAVIQGVLSMKLPLAAQPHLSPGWLQKVVPGCAMQAADGA